MERDELCPFCGAYSPRQCELEEETGGECPWLEIMDEDEIERAGRAALADKEKG